MNDKSTKSICPICKLPTSAGGSASLTQWILICSCNQVVDAYESNQEKTQNMCQKCGKRANPGRQGSFTQWILRSDLCDCEVPEILKPSSPEEVTIELEPIEDKEINEDTISVNGFPSDRFRAIKELGKGASSSVYLSRDTLLNKMVAIKLLYHLGPEQTVQFQNEAKLNTKMKHPCIAQVMDVGISSQSVPYMVLEFFEGVSLEQYIIENHPLEESEILLILAQMLNGINYAHSKKIFHKDIKPANVLVAKSESGQLHVKMIDFGASIFKYTKIDSGSHSFTGTPHYMAPDEPKGKEYTERSEIYSIGCLLHELLTGRTPYQGESAVELLRAHTDSEIPIVEDREDLEHLDKFNQVITKCLQKEPQNRYQSVLEIIEELTKFEFPAPTISTEEETKAAGKQTQTDSKMIIGIGGILVVLVLSIGAFYIFANNYFSEPVIVEEKESSSKIYDYVVKPFPNEKKTKGPLFVPSRNKYLVARDILEVNDEDLKKVPGDTRRLNLTGCTISGQGLKYLVKRKVPIKNLVLNGTPVTNENLKYLSKLKGLRYLSLSSTSVTTKGLKNIGNLKLNNLYLANANNIDDSSIDVIVEQFSTVKKLSIGSLAVTDAGIKKLAQLKGLQKLNLRRENWTDETFDAIFALPIKSLQIHLSNITNKDLLKFKNSKSIKELTLENCESISPAGIKRLQKLRPDIKIGKTGY